MMILASIPSLVLVWIVPKTPLDPEPPAEQVA